MKKLLTIKHWQLFLLLIIVPAVIQIAGIISIEIIQNSSFFINAFPVMMIAVVGIFMGWLYTLGTNLYHKLPSDSGLHLKTFKIFVLIPAFYMIGISLFMLALTKGAIPHVNPFIFLFILPLHLGSMFCICYSLYFIAKALKAVEMQRRARFGDYIGEFFLLWFFPVGVWILQPRINKIFGAAADGYEIASDSVY